LTSEVEVLLFLLADAPCCQCFVFALVFQLVSGSSNRSGYGSNADADRTPDQSFLFTYFNFSSFSLYLPFNVKTLLKVGVVEKPAEIQTSIRLASHLIRAPKSISGGCEFESPLRRELGALTKKMERPLGSGLSTGKSFIDIKNLKGI
jgi:hypothetical protein